VDFHDVDCAVIVERVIDGRPSATTRIIRAAQKLSLHELMDEIDHATSTDDASFSAERKIHFQKPGGSFPLLPAPGPVELRAPIRSDEKTTDVRHRKFHLGEHVRPGQRMAGTHYPPCGELHPRGHRQTAGGRGPEILPRDILSATLTFDHDLIDGAEATRFINVLKKSAARLQGLEEVAS
jgi:hypothetical protein